MARRGAQAPLVETAEPRYARLVIVVSRVNIEAVGGMADVRKDMISDGVNLTSRPLSEHLIRFILAPAKRKKATGRS